MANQKAKTNVKPVGVLPKRDPQKGITLIALIITTIFSYDENSKFSNNKGFLLKAI